MPAREALQLAPGPSTIALVIGKKASGKTTLVRRGLARLPRWVAWDVRGELASIQGARLWTDLAAWRDHLLDGGRIEREVFACPSAQFDAWCRWIYATRHLFVVMEEIGRYCASGRAPRGLADLIDRSRHCHVDLVFTTSRPVLVPASIRTQVDELLVSRVGAPTDCDYLKSWLGGPAVERAKALPQNHFLRFRQP